MYHEPYIFFINAHAESVGSHYHPDIIGHPFVLIVYSLIMGHTGMVNSS